MCWIIGFHSIQNNSFLLVHGLEVPQIGSLPLTSGLREKLVISFSTTSFSICWYLLPVRRKLVVEYS